MRLSHSDELRLRLRWVAIMYGRLDADMAITGGVHDAIDVLKCMMAGANVAMMTSALLRHGVEHLPRTLAELREWMDRHEYESIQQMKGSTSQRNVSATGGFERAQYLRALRSYPQHGTSPCLASQRLVLRSPRHAAEAPAYYGQRLMNCSPVVTLRWLVIRPCRLAGPTQAQSLRPAYDPFVPELVHSGVTPIGRGIRVNDAKPAQEM
ncbi:MAG: hypothetical protein U0V87_15925 [Acidobacteriota bacterium]